MPTTADWGWGWVIAAYTVSWAVLIGYTRYVSARSRAAHDALVREARRAEGGA